MSEAWAQLLDAWLPCLLDETQQACAFMTLYRDKRSAATHASAAGGEGARGRPVW